MLRTYALSLVFLVTIFAEPTDAIGLQKVWEIDLKKSIENKGERRQKTLRVTALRVSPDGRWLAAVVEGTEPIGHDESKDRLFIVQIQHPEAEIRQFEIPPGVEDDENLAPDVVSLHWSASGDAIKAGAVVIRLRDRQTCDLDWRAAFFSVDRAISRDRADLLVGGDRNISHFTIYDESCRAKETWEVAEDWFVADVSEKRGLLAVEREFHPPIPLRTERLIVDPVTRKVLHRWPGNVVPGYQFADGGKAICGGSDVRKAERAPVICWDVDTGQKINEAPTANGGTPISTSTYSSRVVVSDYRRRKILFGYEYVEDFKRRVVWDFRTGKEIASWRPDFQTYEDSTYTPQRISPPKQNSEPFKFAISTDGQYVVEGGNGILRWYRIEP